MGINSIKAIIKEYIVSMLDGFDEFTYKDNLVEMGILTREFLFSLIQFLESAFEVKKIYMQELYKDQKQKILSINTIAQIIQQKKYSKKAVEVTPVNHVTFTA